MALVRACGELEDRLAPIEARLAHGESPKRRFVDVEESSVGKIRQLRGVTWEWRDDAPEEVSENPGLGVIAQDVERVFPELVERGEDGYLGVHYYGLIGPLIEAVKEPRRPPAGDRRTPVGQQQSASRPAAGFRATPPAPAASPPRCRTSPGTRGRGSAAPTLLG